MKLVQILWTLWQDSVHLQRPSPPEDEEGRRTWLSHLRQPWRRNPPCKEDIVVVQLGCKTRLTCTYVSLKMTTGGGVIQWRCLRWDRNSQCVPCNTAGKLSWGKSRTICVIRLAFPLHVFVFSLIEISHWENAAASKFLLFLWL